MCRGPPGVGRKGRGAEEGRAAGADRKVVWAKGWGGQRGDGGGGCGHR